MVSDVDLAASVALMLFVCVESLVEDDGTPTAWQVRLAWLVGAVTLVLAAYLREGSSTKSDEAAANHVGAGSTVASRGTAAPQRTIDEQPAAASPTVASAAAALVEASIEAISPGAGSATAEAVLDESTVSASDSATVKKRKSFLRRTANVLVSPLTRSSRSLRASKSKEASSSSPVSAVPPSPLNTSGIVTSSPSPTAAAAVGQDLPSTPVQASNHATPTSAPSPAGSLPPSSPVEMKLDTLGFGPEAPRPPADYVYQNPNTWGYLGHLDEKQTSALEEMRAKNYSCIESRQNPPKVVIDDAFLLRFLRARKFNVEKAQAMLEAHLAWRDKYIPSSVTPNDIASVLGSGLARFGPYSKLGLPVSMIKVQFYDPEKFDGNVDLFIRYVAFFFERALGRLPNGGDKGLLFFDMKGWSLRKHATRFSLKLIGELINIIQAHNPERLDKCILFNTPLIFSGTWSIIKVLLDPVVAGKIMFVSDTKPVLELIDKEYLPVEYGGDRKLPYPIEGFAELHTAPADEDVPK